MKRSETIEPSIRSLTEAKRERLRGHARELVAYRQTVRRGTWIALSAVVITLWTITLLASDTSAV